MKKHLIQILFALFIVIICTGMLSAQPVNLNGGFEETDIGFKEGTDITGWDLQIGGTAAATFEVQDYEVYEGIRALAVETSALGTNAWDVQVVNDPFPVVAGASYTYTCWAKADKEGPIVNFTVGNPAYNEFGRVHQRPMTTVWQEITLTFVVPAGNEVGRAPIHLAESANNSYLPYVFYIDDLKIISQSVGVEEKDLLPANYSLEQNYPNPFNPETTIEFSVPVRSNVSIRLFDVLGNMVKEITSGNYDAGKYRVDLSASDLSSGVYFYKLEAGNFVTAKKLILMK